MQSVRVRLSTASISDECPSPSVAEVTLTPLLNVKLPERNEAHRNSLDQSQIRTHPFKPLLMIKQPFVSHLTELSVQAVPIRAGQSRTDSPRPAPN